MQDHDKLDGAEGEDEGDIEQRVPAEEEYGRSRAGNFVRELRLIEAHGWDDGGGVHVYMVLSCSERYETFFY